MSNNPTCCKISDSYQFPEGAFIHYPIQPLIYAEEIEPGKLLARIVVFVDTHDSVLPMISEFENGDTLDLVIDLSHSPSIAPETYSVWQIDYESYLPANVVYVRAQARVSVNPETPRGTRTTVQKHERVQ